MMLLCDRKILLNRRRSIPTLQATGMSKETDGSIRAIAADGTSIKLRLGEKTLAKQLNDRAKARREKEQEKKRHKNGT